MCAPTCPRAAAEREVPAAAARYLEAHGLPGKGCVWPALARLDWRSVGLALEARAANGEDAIGVTGAFCAPAQTRTLMLVSGADTPAGVSLLPETHVAIVPVGRIVAHMEDGWEPARAQLGQ